MRIHSFVMHMRTFSRHPYIHSCFTLKGWLGDWVNFHCVHALREAGNWSYDDAALFLLIRPPLDAGPPRL